MQRNSVLFLTAAPVFCLLVVAAALSYLFATSERSEQQWVLHTYQVIDQIRKILSDAQDAETGQRGYMLTRQDSYLQPYRNALATTSADIARFRMLTGDNPVQQRRAQQFETLTRGRVDALERTMRVRPSSVAPSPQLLAAMQQGKTQMDALRSAVNGALAEEQLLLRRRTAARHAAEQLEIAATLAAATIALAILALAAWLLVGSNVRLARSKADRDRHAALLQTTLDNIRDGVAVFDGEGKLVAFNTNFFGCMGFPTELAVPGTPMERFDLLANERKQPRFEDLPFVTGGYGAGYRDVTFDNRHVEIYRNHVPHGGFLIACLDVTQRVQSEMALRQAQKMETIGQLTGGVAHDFNNLLQIIGANLDLMAGDLEPGSKLDARLRSAISAVERGARLTGQLLAFARRQTLAPSAVNLARLVQEMADLLRRTLGEQIELETAVAGGLWATVIDPGQLENAILNLAINARDAMPNGGRLTLELANAFLDEVYVRENPDATPGQYVMIAVTDTGSGMSREIAARVFEPFFTTKGEGQGTGLGLSQVYGFTKQSGGHIKIYSELGEGTTIKLYLPRSRQPVPQWSAPRLVEPAAGGSETVLVVEDDEGVRAAVTDMLNELGYSVVRAENAEQAISLLNGGSRADVLFTDVVMPGPINARELARLAKEKLPEIKVLFTSGYTANAIVHNGRLDEGVELLGKPYRKDDLARKLRQLLPDSSRHSVGSAETQSATREPAAEVVDGKGAKILIVEDSALIRHTTVDMVTDLGFRVAEAADATEALNVLRRDSDVSILLTDLGLPGMSGGELVREARKLRPDLAVVAVSGYSEPMGSERVEDANYLQKPFTLEQLRDVLPKV